MVKIKLEYITITDNGAFLLKKINHPFVYPSGCIDLFPIIKFSNRNVYDLTKEEILDYLVNPKKYEKFNIPVFPKYFNKSFTK